MLAEERERVRRFHDLREEEDSDLGVRLSDLSRSLRAFVRLRRRHADVDDRDIRLVAANRVLQLVGIGRLGENLEAALGEDAGEPFAKEGRVLGDHYSHGISPMIRVPPPGGLSTMRRPPWASTRSASPRRPVPPSAAAPPTPLSATSITSLPS